MLRVWRLVKAAHGATAFDGEGARRFGGRWNSPGVRIVYASGSRALAALETLVHMGPGAKVTFALLGVELREDQVETHSATDLPLDWTHSPVPRSTQRLGDRWIAAGRSVALRIPSVVVPDEPNYLLNPEHPDFPRLRIGPPQPFAFDPRLLER